MTCSSTTNSSPCTTGRAAEPCTTDAGPKLATGTDGEGLTKSIRRNRSADEVQPLSAAMSPDRTSVQPSRPWTAAAAPIAREGAICKAVGHASSPQIGGKEDVPVSPCRPATTLAGQHNEELHPPRGLCDLLSLKFGRDQHQELIRRFCLLKQTTSVADCLIKISRAFESWLS